MSAAVEKDCDGIIAKHWRTRILGANVHAYKDLTWSYGTTSGDMNPRAIDQDRDAWIAATYLDWSTRQFGVEAGPSVASLLASIDQSGEGGLLPTPLGFGPAEIQSSRDDDDAPRTWAKAQEDYAFIEELEASETIDVTFEDRGPDVVQAVFRSVELELPDLEPGECTLHLRLELAGRTPLITSRPIVVY